MSTPVKAIVPKYVACGSKVKKLEVDAHLIKELANRKITKKVSTYKYKTKSREIDTEGFKVTLVELGTINRSIRNHFFKFSADHMLTQLEKDSREKK